MNAREAGFDATGDLIAIQQEDSESTKLKITLTAATLCCSMLAFGTAAVAAPDSPILDHVVTPEYGAD